MWELQNVSTKHFTDLVQMDAQDVLEEIRSHRNRHHNVALSWLHLYMSKVATAEEAERVPEVLMEYQAGGTELTPTTAGTLAKMAERAESDVALRVFCDSTRFRIWPSRATVERLLRWYSAKGDAEALQLLWKAAGDKGLEPSARWYQYFLRGLARSGKAPTEQQWAVAKEAMEGGKLDTTGLNLLLKACLQHPANGLPVEQALAVEALPNSSTRALKAALQLPNVDLEELQKEDPVALDKLLKECTANERLKDMASPLFAQIGKPFEEHT